MLFILNKFEKHGQEMVALNEGLLETFRDTVNNDLVRRKKFRIVKQNEPC